MHRLHGLCMLMLLSCFLFRCNTNNSNTEQSPTYGRFGFEEIVILPGTPGTIYDAITGDISGWWNHTFSEKPAKFYIDPKPGGGFYEIFDESGDGVLHGTVIYAHRGKLLRFEGPLGLSGRAIQLVCTYEFEAVGSDSTRLKLTVNSAGELEEGWPEVIQKVWHHFIVEQFKPFIESGKHLQ